MRASILATDMGYHSLPLAVRMDRRFNSAAMPRTEVIPAVRNSRMMGDIAFARAYAAALCSLTRNLPVLPSLAPRRLNLTFFCRQGSTAPIPFLLLSKRIFTGKPGWTPDSMSPETLKKSFDYPNSIPKDLEKAARAFATYTPGTHPKTDQEIIGAV